jgi:hypothetical protein
MRLTILNALKATSLCLVVASVPALAFQESKIAPAPSAGSAPLTPQLQVPDAKTGIQLSTPDGGKGTEVRIPGLGKLGVLPKLDFGLDILYGAAEDRRPVTSTQGTSDELTLRGSIKHKF